MTMRSRRMKRSPTQPTASAAPSPKIRPVRAPRRSMAPSTCQWSLRYQTRSWLMSIVFRFSHSAVRARRQRRRRVLLRRLGAPRPAPPRRPEVGARIRAAPARQARGRRRPAHRHPHRARRRLPHGDAAGPTRPSARPPTGAPHPAACVSSNRKPERPRFRRRRACDWDDGPRSYPESQPARRAAPAGTPRVCGRPGGPRPKHLSSAAEAGHALTLTCRRTRRG